MDFIRQELSLESWYRVSMIQSKVGLEAVLRLVSREVDGSRIILPWILFENQSKSTIAAKLSRVIRDASPEYQSAVTARDELSKSGVAGSGGVIAEPKRERSLDAGSLAFRKDISERLVRERRPEPQIQYSQELVVHGHLDGVNSEKASLVVLRFSFTPADRFKSFFVMLEFEYGHDAPRWPDVEGPVIQVYDAVPNGSFLSSNTTKSTSLEEIFVQTADPSTSSPAYGAKPSTLGSEELSTSPLQSQNRVRLESGLRFSPVGHFNNTVYWNVVEHEDVGRGIGDMLRAAILVSRTNDKEFTIKLKLKALLSEADKGLGGRALFSARKAPIRLRSGSDGQVHAEKLPSFISKDRLGRLKVADGLRQLLYAEGSDSGPEGVLEYINEPSASLTESE